MKTISDKELARLVRAAQSGEEAALTELIRATEQELFRFLVFLVRSRSLAQDLAQETYLRVLENLGGLRDPEGFGSWLFRTAKNLYLDYLRSPRNAPTEGLDGVAEMGVTDEGLEIMREVQDLLKPLEPEDRFAFLLVYLHGYSYAEAAEFLNVGENALRSRLHRAKERVGGA